MGERGIKIGRFRKVFLSYFFSLLFFSFSLSSQGLAPSSELSDERLERILSLLSPADVIPYLESIGYLDPDREALEAQYKHPWDRDLRLFRISLKTLRVPEPDKLHEFINEHNKTVEAHYRQKMYDALLLSLAATYHSEFGEQGKPEFIEEASRRYLESANLESESTYNTRWQVLKIAADLLADRIPPADIGSFGRKVEIALESYGKWAHNEFLAEIAEGIFDFKTSGFARIKYTYLGSQKNPQVIAKVVPSGKKATILVINLGLEINGDRVLTDNHFQLQQYNKRLRRDYGNPVLISSIQNEGLVPLSFYLSPKNIFSQTQNYFVSSFDFPTVYGPALAAFSTAVQMSFMVGGFWVDTNLIQNSPADVLDVISKNAPALLVKGSYGMFCATFSNFYDRLVRDKSPLAETLKKSGYVLPANYIVFGLTYGWLNPTSVILASALSLGEKLASTFMIRSVRLREEEGLLHGESEISLEDLRHPTTWSPVKLIRKRFQNGNGNGLSPAELAQLRKEEERLEEVLKRLGPQTLRNKLGGTTLFRANKVIVAREIQGVIRSAFKAGSFAIDKSLGIPAFTMGLYGVAWFSHRKAERIATERAQYYRNRGAIQIAKRFDRHAQRLLDDRWLIPGLKPIVLAKAERCLSGLKRLSQAKKPD